MCKEYMHLVWPTSDKTVTVSSQMATVYTVCACTTVYVYCVLRERMRIRNVKVCAKEIAVRIYTSRELPLFQISVIHSLVQHAMFKLRMVERREKVSRSPKT